MSASDLVYYGVLLLVAGGIIGVMVKGLRASERMNDEQLGEMEKKPDAAVVEAPDGFFRLGNFDVMAAKGMLQQFEESGIRFLLEKVEKRVFSGGGNRRATGYYTVTSFDIFVSKDDEQKAMKIYTVDWKV